ncbi:MAG: hypothetical protein MZW92_31905 [Comamonadaceae bacterium]|nr:hypothetical protein [Comamonadaceae bacterium]
MPAPSKNFTAIADTAVDVDSPIDEVLMTALRDRDQNLYEWIGHGFTPAQAHTSRRCRLGAADRARL